MPSRFVPLSCLILAATVTMALTSQNRARGAKPGGTTAAAFAITDLGSPRYRNWHLYWSKAYGINQPDNQGLMDVIGWDTVGSAVWEARTNGGIVSRNNLAANIKVTGVNDHGVTVGAFDSHLYANIPGVGVVELPGSTGFFPASINNLGHVVSQQQLSGYPELGQGAMWIIAADGTISGPIDLGNFRPLDINDWDEMAGLQDSVAAIARFEAGVLEAEALVVSKLPGLSPGNLGVATAINDGGDVVGYSTDLRLDAGTYRPFLWTANQGLSALGSLGGIHGKALGINNGGQVVGWSYTSGRNSEQRAFLWESGKMSDLNGKLAADSKRTLQSADDINNAGHIVGSMFTLQGGTTTLKSFLLTPTP